MDMVSISLRCIAGSRIARSSGNQMFNCLKNCQTIYQGGCNIFRPLHPRGQGFHFLRVLTGTGVRLLIFGL